MKKRAILCFDLKSFYASVECALRNLNPYTTPLVVADPARAGSIVLAVSPYLRAKGYPSRMRLYEVNKVKDLIIARPRMQTYLDYALKVIDIYLDYVSEEDLFVYSIDEVFLDVTNYLNYYRLSKEELAGKILKEIYSKLFLYATCGIGENMLLAKLALDLESKKSKNYLAVWNYEDIKTKLWPVSPLSKMWGIGERMERNLAQLGIVTVYDLAHYNVNVLRKLFGVIGVELYHHANGRDLSKIQDQNKLKALNKRYSIGQVLFKDYSLEEAKLIIKEMAEELARRLRLNKKMAFVVTLAVGYSKLFGGGFKRQMRMENKTRLKSELSHYYLILLENNYEKKPIRKISIGVTNLTTDKASQLTLFKDYLKADLEEKLESSLDEIKMRFSNNSVDKATVLLDYSTKRRRNKTIGGHYA
ncbi:MAG: damage repair protein [Acholeplasmatales bacterium]|jgi:DNA polymerase V|nr:damage repair protein [Acholeplasmataceae bacterium]MDY0115464.1 damage repair protein [Acholeplasmatales bacterium]MCK9234136.1 damage repair protein [Acholeplasmataceae bacterium]MCK9288893.1 damage repair protein [Acholeplasmataceae bacterium]MCK9427487.1 damage repair protein [Acholeplasmataceae bacterium]